VRNLSLETSLKGAELETAKDKFLLFVELFVGDSFAGVIKVLFAMAEDKLLRLGAKLKLPAYKARTFLILVSS
jgi:hypothetical protein